MKRTRFPSHDFPDEGEVRTCRDCGAEWDTREYDDPPPWSCRRAPLESTGTLDRIKGLRPVSERRQEKRHQDGVKHTYGPYFRWVADRDCFACGSHPCVPHHVKTVKSGGRDPKNLVDLCLECHEQVHREGPSRWGEKHGIHGAKAVLKRRADALWRIFARRRPRLAQRLEKAAGGGDTAGTGTVDSTPS